MSCGFDMPSHRLLTKLEKGYLPPRALPLRPPELLPADDVERDVLPIVLRPPPIVRVLLG